MVDHRITARLQQLQSLTSRINAGVIGRIDSIIREAERLARRIRLCPHCGEVMRLDGTMYRCPGCGLCRDDSDEPTADFSSQDTIDP